VIAVVGEALLDAHRDGEILRLFPGGGPFNTAIALGHLGVPACYIGAISRDRSGRQLEEGLEAAGVDTRRVAHVDAPTPLAIVELTAAEPSFSFYLEGTAHEALRPSHLGALAPDVAALHVGTLALATEPPGAAIAEFAAREADRRLLVIDPNIRPALGLDRAEYLSRFEPLAGVADIVKLSTPDIAWLYPGESPGAVVDRLISGGAGCVVLTSGGEGAEAWTARSTARVAAPHVEVVDTVGAGDAFGAGLLASLWRAGKLGKDAVRHLSRVELGTSLAYAAATAAAQCSRASAWGPAPDDVARFQSDVAVDWDRADSLP
jgi:fructokinase